MRDLLDIRSDGVPARDIEARDIKLRPSAKNALRLAGARDPIRGPGPRALVPCLLLALLTGAGCGDPLPRLVGSVPAGGASVRTTAWIDLEFASDVPPRLEFAFSLSCGGDPVAFVAERVASRRVVLNPAPDLPAGVPCELSWVGPEGVTAIAFDTIPAGSSAVVYDRDDPRSFAPYPDDFWLRADPATRTGVRVAFSAPPAVPASVGEILGSLADIANQEDGFSPIGPIVVELSEPADPSSLPLSAAESLDPLASVALFDIDPTSSGFAQRVPFRAEVPDEDLGTGISSPTLIVFPSIPLAGEGHYALVVTRRARSASGASLAPSAFFASAIRAPTSGESDNVARTRAALAPVLAFLETHSVPRMFPEDLALAFGIRVRSTDRLGDDLLAIREDVRAQPAPDFSITGVVPGNHVHRSSPVAAVVTGTWDAPDYRQGEFLARGASGEPVRQRTRPVPFVLALPVTAESDPVPIVIHQHGNPGSADEVLTNAERSLAADGFAVIGFTDILNREAGQSSSLQFQSVFLSVLTQRRVPDAWVETHAEQLAFLRFVETLGSLDVLPIGAPDGVPDLDLATPLAYHGISEGANHGQALLPFAPEIRSAALIVGGARLAETLIAQAPTDLGPDLVPLLPGVRPVEIWAGLALFQSGFDDQDPHLKLPFLYRHPALPESLGRPSVLIQEGINDSKVPNNATESMAWSLGPVPQLPRIARQAPFLPTAAAPLAGNIDVEITAGLSQYVPEGIPDLEPTPGCRSPIRTPSSSFFFSSTDGHFCPQLSFLAQAQVTAFFRSAVGGVPTIIDPDLDSDGDGLRDAEESGALGTDPNAPDSDGDGLLDGFEVSAGFDPRVPNDADGDPDGDGLTNLEEQAAGADPTRSDTDGDGLRDDAEFRRLGTDPARNDSDGDGLADRAELLNGTDPLGSDSDGDGRSDGVELAAGLDPANAEDEDRDSDADGLTNLEELARGSDPRKRDSDGDGLLDGAEVARGTDPLSADTDGGGRQDRFEVVLDGTDPLLGSDDRRDALPTLTDGFGFSWSPDRRGAVALSGPTVANSWFQNSGYSGPAEGLLIENDESGRELRFPPNSTSHATRRLFVPQEAGFARYLDVFDQNGRFAPFLDFRLVFSLGTPNSSLLTSDGDTVPETTDDWVVIDDGPGLAPPVAIVFAGPGAALRPRSVFPFFSFSSTLEIGFLDFSGIGGRTPFLFFAIQADTVEEAASRAAALATLEDPAALRGVPPADQLALANFARPADGDGDGLPDRLEIETGSDPLVPDSDGDGLLDGFEVSSDLDPLVPDDPATDSDGDGLADGEEQSAGTNARDRDSDEDGAEDGVEVGLGTDPLRRDSDGDELLDGFEIRFGLPPRIGDSPFLDSDGDGDSDRNEQLFGTDPRNRDTDGDGIEDPEERSAGLDPLDAADAAGDLDGDGLSNRNEAERNTRIEIADTDFDGIRDGVEIRLGTDPLRRDSDGDGAHDSEEIVIGLDPLDPDSDGDGLDDGLEIRNGLDPFDPGDAERDLDGDGLDNRRELRLGTRPDRTDSDTDGLDDGDEVDLRGTNPLARDTDGGGRSDGDEVLVDATDPFVRFDDRVVTQLGDPRFGLALAWGITPDGSVDGLRTFDLEHFADARLFGRALRSSAYPFSPPSAVLEGGQQELVLPAFEQAGLSVQRKILVPRDGRFLRYLEIFENQTDAEIATTVDLTTTLATDREFELVDDSSHDGGVTSNDDFYVLDNDVATTGLVLTHGFSGLGAAIEPSAVVADLRRGGNVVVRFELSVPPRARVILMHFAALSRSRIETAAEAGRMLRPDGRLLFDLPADERADVVNYALAIDADGDGVDDAADNCPTLRNEDQTDGDGDGRGDACDNCVLDVDASQWDSNADGFGNACDADFSGDGRVGPEDLERLEQGFLRRRGEPGFDPDLDLDGNGAIGISDFNRLRDRFGAAPGPSALPCSAPGFAVFTSRFCLPF